MLNYLPALLVAFLGSILSIKILLPLAPQIGLVDIPNSRKNHSGSIPLIGGLSIFTGVLIASSLFVENSQLLNLYLISSGLIVFLGTLDDLYDLSVSSRIVFQTLVATILVFGANHYIVDLGNILGFGNINLGVAGTIFTILASIALINAFNMIDGIDGLAGSTSIITITSVAILSIFANQTSFTLLALIIVVATVPFVFYNVSTRNPRGKKIFMGDAGSMFMGLTVIWLLTLSTQGADSAFRPVTALWIVAVPVMDMLAIMYRRMRHGGSPFKADNGHIHHILIKLGYSSRQALQVICVIAIGCALFGIIGEVFVISENSMFVIFIMLFAAYALTLDKLWKTINNCSH